MLERTIRTTTVRLGNAWGLACLTLGFLLLAAGPARAGFTPIPAGLPGVDHCECVWGDYDQDGDLDILLAGDYITRVYQNDGLGGFSDIGAGLPGLWAVGADWGDYDNDGDLDILINGYDGTTRLSFVFRNDGAGGFVDIGAGLPGLVLGSADWGDYDNDGHLDILITGYLGGSTYYSRIYRNDGAGGFIYVSTALPGVRDSDAAWGDYDNDGDLDVLITGTHATGNISRVYRNDGGGVFVDIGAGLVGVNGSAAAWGDYDGDGDLDIVLTGDSGGTRYGRVYRNDGAGGFSHVANVAGMYRSSVAWGDYDNDGDLDLLMAGEMPAYNYVARVYRNDAGTFSDTNSGLYGARYSSAVWGDYDGDGDLDILVAGQGASGFRTSVYRNDGVPANTAPAIPVNLAADVSGTTVTFTWDTAGDAETPTAGLTYNLRVGTTPGGGEICAAMAAAADGYRRVAQLGNAQHGTSWTLDFPQADSFYWSVQAVDGAFAGSAFAAEQAYPPDLPLSEGLVAHWSFDADFSADAGGAGFDGTPANGVSIATYGRFGGSAFFERADEEYVSIDVPVITPGSDHSYSAWYKSSVADYVASDRYFVLETYPTITMSYGLYAASPNDLAQVYTAWPTGYSQTSFPGATGADWHNIVVTYDADATGSEHAIYLDGVHVTDLASDAVLSDTAGLIIGSYRNHDGRFWDGWIDDVAVWNRVLTPSDVAVLQASPVSGDWVSLAPDSLTITLDDDLGGGVYGREVTARYQAGTAAPVYAYSIEVTWDPAVVTASKDDFSKPGTGPFHDTLWFFTSDIPGGVRVDAALPGGSEGLASGELFQAAFTAAGVMDYTTDVIALSLVSFRDTGNQPITGVTADDGLVVVDLVAPSVSNVAIANTTLSLTDDYVKNGDAIVVTATVTDQDPELEVSDILADLSGLGGAAGAVASSYAAPIASWTIPAAACTPSDDTLTVTVTATDNPGNATLGSDTIIADNTAPAVVSGLSAVPGHQKVDLSWDDAASNDANYAGVVIRYAAWGDYPEYAVAAPAYPDGPGAGDGTAFDGTGAAHTYTWVPRDVYFFTAFVYDHARNFSAAVAGAQDRATNYWLGDVSDVDYGQYDGEVDVADYTALASTYGLAEGPGFKAECDVGPTHDHSRVGIPEPDDQVQFEDLMIFAMNAGVVGADKTLPTGTSEPVLAWVRLDERTWSLHLAEPCANLKGVNVSADAVSGSVSVSGGALLARQEAPVFLQNIERNGLDAGLALLGEGLGLIGSGELLRVRGDVDLGAVTIQARGIANESFGSESTVPVDDTPVPLVFELTQNTPNPFNPQTAIAFSLPDEQPVRLAVYTLRGRRVAVLVDGVLPAGVHEAVWKGRDLHDRQASSGTYVYRITAGPYSETRKMILMK